MTLVKMFIRPAICLACGHIQLQTDNGETIIYDATCQKQEED